ncbi:MAG TPA: O-antigen ligase family protein [Candidatus Dormibacteraeota bacterium]
MIRAAHQRPARILRGGASWVGALRSPYPATQTALVVTAALTPAYVVRWRVGPLPTTALEAAILVTVLLFALETLRAGSPAAAWRSPLAPPAALFVVAGAVAVLAAPSRVAALGIYRAYVLEPVALAFVAATVVRDWRRAWLVVGGLWLGACVLAVANVEAVLEAARQHQLDIRVPAPVAIYLSPNSVALYLVPLLAVAGAAVLHAASRPVRVAAAVFGVVALPAAILTFSRGGWLAIAAVLVTLALSHRRRWWLLAGLAVLAVGVAAVPYVSHRALLLLHQGAGNTSSDRLRLWALTLHLLAQRPLLGMGLAGFQPTVLPLWKGDATWILYPHNLALDLWAETGLLGLLSFAWALGAAAVLSWLGWRRGGGDWRALHLGVLVALLAVLVHGAVDNPYFKNDLSLEFWMLAALTAAGWRWGRPAGGAGEAV